MVIFSPKHSISTRLSAWFALASLLVFMVISACLYWALENTLQQTETEELLGKVELVQHFIDEAGTTDDMVKLHHHLDDTLRGHGSLRVWLLNKAGAVIYGGSMPPVMSTNQQQPSVIEMKSEKGIVLQGIRKPLRVGTALGAVEVILLMNVQSKIQVLKRFLIPLGLISTIGVVCISLLGFAVVRHGLHPLKRISNEARKISAESLSFRLNEQGLDGELLPLVASFNLALGRVENAYQQTEAFNADVAHELRTPLATLITGTELALLKKVDAVQLKELLYENLEQLQIFSSIIKDMLFLSQADRGAKARRDLVQSVAMVAKDVMHYHEAAIGEAGLHVKIIGDVQCSIDTALIKRALSNLLANATRYALPGSEIHIDIQSTELRELKLEVKNMGETIDPVLLSKIFQRFFRADQSRQSYGVNHGLGLAIVAAIARMHDGRTFAHSAMGKTTVGMILQF